MVRTVLRSLLTFEATAQFISSNMAMGRSLVPTESNHVFLSRSRLSEHESYEKKSLSPQLSRVERLKKFRFDRCHKTFPVLL